MRQSLRKTLLWQGVALLLYLAGMVLFLVVAVNVFLAPPANSVANLTTGDMGVIGMSLLLIVAGRVIGWKYGGEANTVGTTIQGIRHQKPEQSTLEELGYQMPLEETDTGDAAMAYDDGEVCTQCPECGTQNDPQFQYCSNCSSQLPES
jgi:hypothetical protein